MEIKFRGENIFVQPLRTDKSFRVTIDTGLDEYDSIKDIPKLPAEQNYEIVIRPVDTSFNAGRD
jgi:hypothetical protein